MIIVDSNEHGHHPEFKYELEKAGIHVVIQYLSSGDFFLIGERNCIVERKNVFDLLNSLKKRIWKQLKGMKEDYIDTECRLLVEGYFALIRKRKGWNETSVYAQLDSIVAKDGWDVPMVFTPDIEGTIKYLIWKHKSLGKSKTKKLRSLRSSAKKGLSLDYQARYLIEGIPLVGPKKATSLLKHFGSVKKILNASKDELKEVVGNQTANYIIEISSHHFEE